MLDPQTGAVVVTNPALTDQIGQLNKLLSQLLEGGSHLVTGGMAAHAIQWLKTKPFIARRWADYSDQRKAFMGALAAALPASGIVFTFQHPGNGHWLLDVDHLTLVTAGLFAWSFLQNWLWQQGWYMSVIKPKPITGVAPTAPGGMGSGEPAAPVVVTVDQKS